MRYLRFGEIPKSGKSVNFFKLTNEQNEDFTYMLKVGEVERAFTECVPSEAYEDGLSVFEMDKNGMPVLSNMQLITSLLARLDGVVYEVSGDEVSRGNDGEPLISNAKIEKKRRINKEKLLDYVLKILLSNFKNAEYDKNSGFGENKIFKFYAEYKINKKTGEKVSFWEKTTGENWVNVPPYTEYTFNGWTFSNPVDGFETKLGIKR